MKFKEKYNKMIEIIESNITSNNEDIENELSRQFGENLRLLADAFKFISGTTLSKYIRERKLVNVIKTKKRLNISFDEAAEMFGISDAATFSKSAKVLFGKAPSLMTDKELSTFVPLTLDVILQDKSTEKAQADNNLTQKGLKETSFGVTAKQYSEISRALTIAAVYGLSDTDAELAYSLAKRNEIPLDCACDFVSDYELQIENGSILSYPLDELAILSYEYNQSYSEAQRVMYELELSGISSIKDLPEYFFAIYFSEENSKLGLDVKTICEIAEEMEANNLTMNALYDVVDRGEYKYGGDFLEAIERFDQDEAEWDEMIYDAMYMIDKEMKEQEEYSDVFSPEF